MEEKVKRLRFERLRWEYVLTTPIFAVAIYIYFCARNMKELSIPFILVSAAILFLFALAAYFAVYLIVRRGFTTMLFCFFCWIGCYAEPLIRKISYRIQPAVCKTSWGGYTYLWTVLYTFIVLVIAVLFTMLVCKTHKIKQKELCTKFILGVFLILLTMNGVLASFSAFSKLNGVDELELKTTFVKEDGLASPNIYWIHPDGMLGFDAFEKYFGDSQDALTAALAGRGFEISRSANFESSHSTSVAVPILTCPYAYDTWISQYTASHEEAMTMHKYNILAKMTLLRQNAELQKAFDDNGYTVNTIGSNGYYYPFQGGYSWVDGRVWKYGKQQERLLSAESMFSNIAVINAYFELYRRVSRVMLGYLASRAQQLEYHVLDEEAKAVILEAYQYADNNSYHNMRALYDLLNGGYDSPRLTMIHDGTAHGPFCFNEDGSIHEESSDPLDYYAQHIYSGKVVLGMVDMIIESDSDAVIVIQADHGLHQNTEEDFLQAFGEEADAVELWNSTISAVRVPEQYRNGEEHYMMDTPLNIARYLVNNFVGRNYEYLVSE